MISSFGNKVPCSVCGKKFRGIKGLRLHERQAHTCPTDSESVPESRLLPGFLSQICRSDVVELVSVESVVLPTHVSLESDISVLPCDRPADETIFQDDDTRADNVLMGNRCFAVEAIPACVNEMTDARMCSIEEEMPNEKLRRPNIRMVDENPTSRTSGLDFCRRIGMMNNMKAVSVAGDGNCQYAAVIEGMKALGRTSFLNVRELRRRVHEEVVSNSDRYEPFIDATAGPLLNYARGILKRQWGDELTLRAMASILRVTIVVIRFDTNGQFVHCIGTFMGPDNTVYLTLDDRHELTAHYGALIPREDRSGVNRERGHMLTSATERNVRSEILLGQIEYSDRLNIENGEVDDAIMLETSSVISEEGFSACSESSFLGDNIFKVPKNLPSGQGQCEHCGRYFKYLNRHRKCSKTLVRSTGNSSHQAAQYNVRSRRTRQSIDVSDETDLANDSDISSDASSHVSNFSYSACSESSLIDEDGFKVQKNRSGNKERCGNCGRYFKNLEKHIRCSKSLVSSKSSSKRAVESVPCDTISASINDVTNTSSADRSWDDTSTDDDDVRRTSRNRFRTPGNTRIHDLNSDLKAELSKLKKRYRPWTRREMRTDDPLYYELKDYHDFLGRTLDCFATEKMTPEVMELIDVKVRLDRLSTQLDDDWLNYTWSEADRERLSSLTAESRTLKLPLFPWSAGDETRQGKYNHARMQFLVDRELVYKLLTCPRCGITALLVGFDEVRSDVCMECLEVDRKRPDLKKKYTDAWAKVRPADSTPTVVRTNSTTGGKVTENLPTLNAAEQGLISLIQPCVTIRRNFIASRKYKQESLNLLHNPERTWCKILPREDLHDRFVIIERRFKDGNATRYMIANPSKVRVWLSYLFENHPVYVRKLRNGELEMSEEALHALESQSELASVDYDPSLEDEVTVDNEVELPGSADMHDGLTGNEMYSFQESEYLYLKKEHALKITKDGKIEKIPDEQCRQPTYEVIPGNICFAHLYPHGEAAPGDCAEHTMARWLLKKQSQFAQRTADGKLQWTHAEHGVHMMHQYARIVEMNIRALVGWYINQHPERANAPLQSLVDAFREGLNGSDQQSSHFGNNFPDLQGILTKIRHTREKWFSEQQNLHIISRDLASAHVFFTLNTDPRNWEDCRKLIFELEHGAGKTMPSDYYVWDTQEWTRLIEKHSCQLAVFLYKKCKLFQTAFLRDICRIPEREIGTNTTHPVDRTEHGWSFSRVEFTATRGLQHHHALAKLPNVLDTAILSRMVQNMRVVREELKHCNIRPGCYEQAFKVIKCGLLASRYLVLLADSISTCAFFTTPMTSDQFDESKIIDLDVIRSEFVQNYLKKDITKATNPIMRKFDSSECHSNLELELASVAATNCLHLCMPEICGRPKSGTRDANETTSCRFKFPKKNVRFTVPQLLEIDENRMELQMLMRRTNGRIPNLQRYFLQYYRGNHDFSVLADSAHKMRYVTKYVSKSGQTTVLLNEMIQFLEQKTSSVVPPSIKQALTQILLADCAHRSYMSKPELAYKVMDLPQVRRSFSEVKTLAHYPRGTIIERESGVELSDRTDYSSYAERCLSCTETKGGLRKEDLSQMNLRQFAETINSTWVLNKGFRNSEQETQSNKNADNGARRGLQMSDVEPDDDDDEIMDVEIMDDGDDASTQRGLNNAEEVSARKSLLKWRCRDRTSGHWVMSKKCKACHVKPSTLLFTDLARNYVPMDDANKFFDLPFEKRNQLKRAYQEIVLYLPWQDDPDKTFLSADVLRELESDDPDSGSRYSLKRLHEYFKVYMTKWRQGIVAPPGSQWHRDNQYCYTMYKAMQHNQEVDQDMRNGDGVVMARLESVDEADGRGIEVQPGIVTPGDDDQFPEASNFIAADVLDEAERQTPPSLMDLHVAYAENKHWKSLKNLVSNCSENLFMARPPEPDVQLEGLTPMQRHAYDLVANGLEKTLLIQGIAGSGKTLIALHLAQRYKGRCQCCATTGRASANFCGPTIHGAFLWGAKGTFNASSMSPAKKEKLQNFYADTDLFIFDEIFACGADLLAQIDETMRELFCRVTSNGKRRDIAFGGKRVVFMGDVAQLKPIRSCSISDTHVNTSVLRYRSRSGTQYFRNAQRGQHIYREYLVPKCIWLQQGQRNTGLLQHIMDNLREGKQTEEDLDKLLYQRHKHPDYIAQRGIHYSNESAALFNCRQLWDECKLLGRHFYVCPAVYHVDDNNENIVRMLSAIPASDFCYAPNLLCLAEGCEVRLITNIDTGAGLTTNATGNVVRIIFDNADADKVTKGDYVPPFCILVNFPSFQGFVLKSEPNERYFPFTNRQLVPVYRRQFSLEKIPENIRKRQARKFCYREQFPIDLSSNLTAHRGQGQNWKNCTLSVNLGLESPQSKLPTDFASICYVACTRITQLKDLFLSPIFPTVWLQMGKSDGDIARRKHEDALRKAAQEFASVTGKYEECLAEMRFKNDFSTEHEEWRQIVNGTASAGLKSCPTLMPDDDLNALIRSLDDEETPVSLKPATHERFIGIDQGIKTFSMIAVDKVANNLPRVVGAHQIDLEQVGLLDAKRRFSETDVLLKLAQHSPLFQWIDGSNQEQSVDEDGYLPVADRVVVAVEQMSIENAYYKQLGPNLATALQRQFDIRKCVVKMSQPHIHRKNGPMFKLGDEIIEACNLEPPSYESLQTRVDRKRLNAGINGESGSRCQKRRRISRDDDVEPSDESTDDGDDVPENENSGDAYQTLRRQVQHAEYKKKKAMSSAIFRYVMSATPAQQLAMVLEVCPRLQAVWNNVDSKVKLDDLGDALLHAVDSLLSHTGNFRQVIPSASTLHKNRTIVIVLLPDKAFWIVMQCVCNKFVLQDMGVYSTNLLMRTFSAQTTVDTIAAGFHPRLLKAISQFDKPLDCLSDTGYIKIIVKQLKSYRVRDMTGNMAGTLVNATVAAVKKIADVACPGSQLSVSNSKKSGWLYSRTCKENGRRLDVLRSSGKHLNGILTCFQWFRTNLPDFVRDRPLRIDEEGRYKFFHALRQVALDCRSSNDNGEPVMPQLESISLNDNVMEMLRGFSSRATQMTLADLILIALDNNSQYVSGASKNNRRGSEKQKRKSNMPADAHSQPDGAQATAGMSTMQVCTCGTPVNCTSAKHLRLNVTRS